MLEKNEMENYDRVEIKWGIAPVARFSFTAWILMLELLCCRAPTSVAVPFSAGQSTQPVLVASRRLRSLPRGFPTALPGRSHARHWFNRSWEDSPSKSPSSRDFCPRKGRAGTSVTRHPSSRCAWPDQGFEWIWILKITVYSEVKKVLWAVNLSLFRMHGSI